MTDKERILLSLKKAGAFGMTADALIEDTGTRRVAARIRDLRNEGHRIEGGYIDRKKGIYRYKLVSEAPAAPEPADDFSETLFDGVPARKTSHYLVDGEAA